MKTVNIKDLPTLNVLLNSASTILLILGYIMIKRGNREIHKKIMLTALTTSLLFLCSYLIYHYNAGSVEYPYYDWTRRLYFSILIPHILLAAAVWPFIIKIVYHALREEFSKHKRLAQRVWWVWLFVSVSGIVIYLMLYRYGG